MIAKTFFGLENVLAAELAELGGTDVRAGRRMVSFKGDKALLYRANLCCRTATRILKPIATFTARDDSELYRGIGLIDWHAHLDPDGSLAIDPVVHGPAFSNSLYAAQRAKDAIVDQFRAACRRRPSVDLKTPRLRINLHIANDRITVYLDASGDSLHKRGYRVATGEAPLNEVLAAGILRLAGWHENPEVPLADFMCGSGTLVIEAAMMARRIAPGLVRKQFGYMHWKDFDRSLHDSRVEQARGQVVHEIRIPLQGSDLDPRVIDMARRNAQQAGVAGDITWLVGNFDAVRPPAPSGTLVTNPPYDERMKVEQAGAVYRRIGDALKRNWQRYTAHILTGNLEAAKHFGLRPSAKLRLFNGPIECRVLTIPITASARHSESAAPRRGADHLTEFRNRLGRMAKHWHRWARRQDITAYRIYDRDVPHVPLAIDWYNGQVLVGLYRRPHDRTEIEQREWLDSMAAVIGDVLQLPLEKVILKSGSQPGAKKDRNRHLVEVRERGLRYQVDLSGGSNTGLELDQRTLRDTLRSEAAGKRCLFLFARAGTLSLAAAAGGAAATTSVDASSAAIEWASRNFGVNQLTGGEHTFVCQDPLEFVRQLAPAEQSAFDLIVVVPPGFDGQRRVGVWNVQDGHGELLGMLSGHLDPGGKIYFITTFRRLKLDASKLSQARVREITRQTVPPDFRNKKVHRAWSIALATT
jgi:23S rRNA (guanine2445-N2)-methyltransferase / 23S rRNA (guanine2069-N7)-methyltransferase